MVEYLVVAAAQGHLPVVRSDRILGPGSRELCGAHAVATPVLFPARRFCSKKEPGGRMARTGWRYAQDRPFRRSERPRITRRTCPRRHCQRAISRSWEPRTIRIVPCLRSEPDRRRQDYHCGVIGWFDCRSGISGRGIATNDMRYCSSFSPRDEHRRSLCSLCSPRDKHRRSLCSPRDKHRRSLCSPRDKHRCSPCSPHEKH